MTKTFFAAPIAAAIALTAVGTASAETPRTEVVTATFQHDTKRFCVARGAADLPSLTNTGMRKQCMTRQQWREHGVAFTTPKRAVTTQVAAR